MRLITVAGQVDVSLQLLEQSRPGLSHVDQIVYRELLAALDEEVKNQVLNGTGEIVGGRQRQVEGMLNVSGINEVNASGTSTSPDGRIRG